MELLDLGLIKIYYLKEEKKYVQMLESILVTKLKPLRKNIDNYRPYTCTIYFHKEEPKENTYCFLINPNEPILQKLYMEAVPIIKEILKVNIHSCYYHLLDLLMILLYQDNWEEIIDMGVQSFLKNICSPNQTMMKTKEIHLEEMQLVYLMKKYGSDLLKILNSKSIAPSLLKQDAFEYLKEEFYRKLSDIKTPQDVLYYILGNIKYGWINQNGEFQSELHSNFIEEYRIPTIEETITNHFGCCVDQARVSAYLLEYLGYPTKIRLFWREVEGKKRFHVYTLYWDQVWYRIDTEGNEPNGLKKVNTLEEDESILKEESQQEELKIMELPKEIEGKTLKEVIKLTIGESRKRI